MDRNKLGMDAASTVSSGLIVSVQVLPLVLTYSGEVLEVVLVCLPRLLCCGRRNDDDD